MNSCSRSFTESKCPGTFNVDPNPVVSDHQADKWWRFKVNLELYGTGGEGFQINTIRSTVSSAVTGTILFDYNYEVEAFLEKITVLRWHIDQIR